MSASLGDPRETPRKSGDVYSPDPIVTILLPRCRNGKFGGWIVQHHLRLRWTPLEVLLAVTAALNDDVLLQAAIKQALTVEPGHHYEPTLTQARADLKETLAMPELSAVIDIRQIGVALRQLSNHAPEQAARLTDAFNGDETDVPAT